MPTIIDGTNGVDKIAAGAIEYADLPTGSVLQVVSATYGTLVSSSSSTFADTGLTVTITPKFSTSKILVTARCCGLSKSAANAYMGMRLVRNTTGIFLFETQSGFTSSSVVNSWGGDGTTYLDSPATTSATIYKIQFSNNGLGSVYMNDGTSLDGSTITVMEIAG